MNEVIELFEYWWGAVKRPWGNHDLFWAALTDLRDGDEGAPWKRKFKKLVLDEGQPREKSYCFGCKHRFSYLRDYWSCKFDTSLSSWDVVFCSEKES